jgi:hypothetical protein
VTVGDRERPACGSSCIFPSELRDETRVATLLAFTCAGQSDSQTTLERVHPKKERWWANLFASVALVLACGTTTARERANFFNDPFIQATDGIASCPVPEGPVITEAQMRSQSHSRAERGTSCYQSGRCRLPNSYLYDKEIIPRVKKAIDADGGFVDTSVWAEGQRRWVWLKGCVRTQAQADALERLIRSIDDVEGVINQLTVQPP